MRWPTAYGERFIIRNAFFRRVITKCAASSLACDASERKFRLRGSFSKYSTRHGAHSVSNSSFGNSSINVQRSVSVRGAAYRAVATRRRVSFPSGEIRFLCWKVESAFAPLFLSFRTESRNLSIFSSAHPRAYVTARLPDPHFGLFPRGDLIQQFRLARLARAC